MTFFGYQQLTSVKGKTILISLTSCWIFNDFICVVSGASNQAL